MAGRLGSLGLEGVRLLDRLGIGGKPDDAVQFVAIDEEAVGRIGLGPCRLRLVAPCAGRCLLGIHDGKLQLVHEHRGLHLLAGLVHPSAAQAVVEALALALEAFQARAALALAGGFSHGHVHLAGDESGRPHDAFHDAVGVVARRLGAPT